MQQLLPVANGGEQLLPDCSITQKLGSWCLRFFAFTALTEGEVRLSARVTASHITLLLPTMLQAAADVAHKTDMSTSVYCACTQALRSSRLAVPGRAE